MSSPLNLGAAEKKIERHLEDLDSLIWTEREYVERLVPRQRVSWFTLSPEEEFPSLSPRHLHERPLLRFIETV